MKDLLINKIFENIDYYHKKKKNKRAGVIIASISVTDPDYYYHWIRDSALTMKTIIDYYIKTNDHRCFKQIINYIENEYELQVIDSMSGLGEPKFNVDRTSFNESWGRPQNDGPALRGIAMIKIYNILKTDHYKLSEFVLSIIKRDLEYILDNIDSPSYDLWEEIYGYHLYTRLVQHKFLKDIIDYKINIAIYKRNTSKKIMTSKEKLKELITHHKIANTSFDENGKIVRQFDASLLLAMAHIDYDNENIDIFSSEFIYHIKELISFYRHEYNINNKLDFILLGRYKNDKYFNGNPWIITTCALVQLLNIYKKNNILINDLNIDVFVSNFKNYIKNIDNLDIAEQVDRDMGKFTSALKLTWNYSELYYILD